MSKGRLGGWRLHAGGGWSSRANHTLPEGDPGCAPAEALGRVVNFHAQHATTPRLMLIDGSPGGEQLAPLLAARGWRTEQSALMMVSDLRRLEGGVAAPAGHAISWWEQPSPEWLELMGRPDPSRMAVLTAVPAHYLEVRESGALVAIARAVVTADWLGISCVHVVDGLRGRGIGSWLMTEVVRRGRAHGARFGYLQVTEENVGARRLYERLGWSQHHRYVYSVPGEAAQAGQSAGRGQDVAHE